MPTLRCLDEDCGEEWFEPSDLAVGAMCRECGGPTEVADDYHEWDEQGPREKNRASDAPRLVHARKSAHAVLRTHDITAPPVPVRAIARARGFEVVERSGLGDLRARLRGMTIEVRGSDHEYVKRFSIAHELGHDVLATTHSDGSPAEQEANAFAGELLAPGHLLRAELAESTELDVLRRRFEVSRDVVRIAAAHHGLADRLTE